MMPLAVLSWTRKARKRWPRFGSRNARRALAALAAGELIMDKLPSTPSRMAPPALVPRLVTGALAGAAGAAAQRESKLAGALVGLAAAVGAALLFSRLRIWAGRRQLANVGAGALEDVLAFGLATAATRPLA